MHEPSLEMSAGSVDPSGSDCQLKSCTDCQTTTTPLWRAGPSGPKSLCNACGIRFRKNRRMTPASKKGMIASRGSGPLTGDRFKMSLKVQMLGLGLWEHRSVIQKKRRSSSLVGEEEQAAFLLMALSSGFV